MCTAVRFDPKHRFLSQGVLKRVRDARATIDVDLAVHASSLPAHTAPVVGPSYSRSPTRQDHVRRHLPRDCPEREGFPLAQIPRAAQRARARPRARPLGPRVQGRGHQRQRCVSSRVPVSPPSPRLASGVPRVTPRRPDANGCCNFHKIAVASASFPVPSRPSSDRRAPLDSRNRRRHRRDRCHLRG